MRIIHQVFTLYTFLTFTFLPISSRNIKSNNQDYDRNIETDRFSHKNFRSIVNSDRKGTLHVPSPEEYQIQPDLVEYVDRLLEGKQMKSRSVINENFAKRTERQKSNPDQPRDIRDDKLLNSLVPKMVDAILGQETIPGDLIGKEVRRNVEIGPNDDPDDNDGSNDSVEEDSILDQGVFPVHGCDYAEGDTCWYNREIGDSITLALNISGIGDTFSVRWAKVYGTIDKKSNLTFEIYSEKVPWNIVMGSGGAELRVSPITDTDMDRNGFSAKVFTVNRELGKQTSKLMREIIFRINVLPIETGSVYAGEEIMLNIENFITLPQRGINFEWAIERKPDLYEPLPSNMRVSRSRRSVTIKELKKDQDVIIVCAMYSSTGLSVAKRRFKIQKPREEEDKRSLKESPDSSRHFVSSPSRNKWRGNRESKLSSEFTQYYPSTDLQRNKNHERYRMDVPLPRSRLHKRSLQVYQATKRRRHNPSRLYHNEQRLPKKISYVDSSYRGSHSIKKRIITPPPVSLLEELSLDSDGTLDNIIPKEVHVVEPRVVLIKHKSTNSTPGQEFVFNCSSNYDCGPKASCIFEDRYPDGNRISPGHCQCNPEYEGDGWRCHKPPYLRRREERVRRQILKDPLPPPPSQSPQSGYQVNDMPIRHDLFYATNSRPQMQPEAPFLPNQQVGPQRPDTQVIRQDQQQLPINTLLSGPGNLANLPLQDQSGIPLDQDDDAMILSKCKGMADCSPHASCVPVSRLSAICTCDVGYRGNGLFCWEIPDFTPQFNPIRERSDNRTALKPVQSPNWDTDNEMRNVPAV